MSDDDKDNKDNNKRIKYDQLEEEDSPPEELPSTSSNPPAAGQATSNVPAIRPNELPLLGDPGRNIPTRTSPKLPLASPRGSTFIIPKLQSDNRQESQEGDAVMHELDFGPTAGRSRTASTSQDTMDRAARNDMEPVNFPPSGSSSRRPPSRLGSRSQLNALLAHRSRHAQAAFLVECIGGNLDRPAATAWASGVVNAGRVAQGPPAEPVDAQAGVNLGGQALAGPGAHYDPHQDQVRIQVPGEGDDPPTNCFGRCLTTLCRNCFPRRDPPPPQP